ncbi:hypothetical protein PG988_010201 [Apiospora saccharicola]
MRLIDCETLELKEFNEIDVPEYVILSHTWGSEEVSFEEMTSPAKGRHRAKEGFHKISLFASVAARHDFRYIWVDTCCIRKDSSSELSEAINSMYTWYKNARRCYVYLNDVDSDSEEEFKRCRWLSRGWTLQELIAPEDVFFYSKHGEMLFAKEHRLGELSALTGISQEHCVENEMGGKEGNDEARGYGLLFAWDTRCQYADALWRGGQKAFIRLQEEVMKRSDDQSLFLWKKKEESYTTYLGLLAPSPREFVDSPDVVFAENFFEDRPYSSTNKGISIRLDLVPSRPDADEHDVYIALLNCQHPGHDAGKPIGIFLKRLEGNQFVRIDAHRILDAAHPHPNCFEMSSIEHRAFMIYQAQRKIKPDTAGDGTETTGEPPSYNNDGIGRRERDCPNATEQPALVIVPTDLYVRQSIRLPVHHRTPRVYGFVFTAQIYIQGVYLADMWPFDSWSAYENCFKIYPREQSKNIALLYRSRGSHEFGTLAVVLQWDRKTMLFNSRCLKDVSWPVTTWPVTVSTNKVIGDFSRSVSGSTAQAWFSVSGIGCKVKVDMVLGMRRDDVVIKVNVIMKWNDKRSELAGLGSPATRPIIEL